ncbi:MAG TPA: NAD(P)-dependent oxidoreductase [candidate division Zixibacteria bacterium]|nr:NAD(P)-dependent oxidoreductase [candidate division Zixibacteria bacterium]
MIATSQRRPVFVVEDDSFLRVIKVVLDPAAPAALAAAFTHFCAHDLDFPAWRERVRSRVGRLYPAEVRLARSQADLRASLSGAVGAVVEALAVGADEIAAAGGALALVQKYGTITSRIELSACDRAGVRVLTLRRRANVSAAEQALALMLALARKLPAVANRVSVEQLEDGGFEPTRFDRAHTPNGNWARIGGLRTLYGRRLGIIGLGEIGREVAQRALAFGMEIAYTQRRRLAAAEEERYGAVHCSLAELLETSDCVSLHLPRSAETRGFIGRAELRLIKPAALLVNVSQPAHVDREALLEALSSGRLGGFAMDGFYEEPAGPDDPLLRLPNVIVTPRLGGSPRSNSLDDIEEILVNLSRAV